MATTKGFTQVENEIIDNMDLSLSAIGLYSLIKRYSTIKDFKIAKKFFQVKSGLGEKGFNTVWKELKEKGALLESGKERQGSRWIYNFELIKFSKKKKESSKKPVVDVEEEAKEDNVIQFHTPENMKMEQCALKQETTTTTEATTTTEINEMINYIAVNTNLKNLTEWQKYTCEFLRFDILRKAVKRYNLEHGLTYRKLTLCYLQEMMVTGEVPSDALLDVLKVNSQELTPNNNNFNNNNYSNNNYNNNNYNNNNYNNNNYGNPKPLNFTNYSQREYDYDLLEKQLLGWDD